MAEGAPAAAAPSATSTGSSWGSGWLPSAAFDAASLTSGLDSLSKRASAVGGLVQKRAIDGANTAALAAAAAADALKQGTGKDAEELSKLQRTVSEFLTLSGVDPAQVKAADNEGLCALVRSRGLELVRAAESFRTQAEKACERGKAYKAQAKQADERYAAALERIRQLESANPGLAAAVELDSCLSSSVVATPAGAGGGGAAAADVDLLIDVASTPAFLHEAEHDLLRPPRGADIASLLDGPLLDGPLLGSPIGSSEGGETKASTELPLEVRIVAASAESVVLSIVRAHS